MNLGGSLPVISRRSGPILTVNPLSILSRIGFLSYQPFLVESVTFLGDDLSGDLIRALLAGIFTGGTNLRTGLASFIYAAVAFALEVASVMAVTGL